MRSLVIITHNNTFCVEQGCFYIPEKKGLNAIPFSNAKTILGQEHPFAIYNMHAENGVNFNLEAFAIVAGTIQENGTLFLLCPHWDNLEHELDFDALRWNENHAVACPNFYRHFKSLVEKYGFEVKSDFPESPDTSGQISSIFCKWDLTEQQQNILEKLPLDPANIHLITAPRGRGKSTIAGKLAETMAKIHPVIITARSHTALPNFWKGIESDNIRFFAPDRLIQAVENHEIFANTWLFIDEAASLPLPMLAKFCDYFDKVVLTTTTQNYEGTGRGFELKLPKMLNKPFKHWTLSQPLRWSENDPLEQFINELLLLSNESRGVCHTPSEFYDLLASAHYKTTPTDLRRLFDGENQILHSKVTNNRLLGGIWAVNEGSLSEELAQAIWLGERRPQGNLVAQYLCFQGNLPQACQLRSVRISRIAVKTEKQNQGIGKRLVSDFILQISQQKRPLDFISVSFGLTAPFYGFWLSCGFQLVQVTPNKEASSGYRSAMMVYPLSEQGKQFFEEAKQAFARDFALQPFFTEICADLQIFAEFQPLAEWDLNETDWQNLTAFTEGKRSLSAVYISLKRAFPSMILKEKATKAEIAEYRKVAKLYLENN